MQLFGFRTPLVQLELNRDTQFVLQRVISTFYRDLKTPVSTRGRYSKWQLAAKILDPDPSVAPHSVSEPRSDDVKLKTSPYFHIRDQFSITAALEEDGGGIQIDHFPL